MSRKTVLIVEDHDDLRALFGDALVLAGFAVRQAANGMDALRLLDSSPPDVIVLDLGLPHVTGYDVLSELKHHPHTANIPVLVVTGRSEAVEGISGACVLQKPVELGDLVRAVQACLSGAASRSAPKRSRPH